MTSHCSRCGLYTFLILGFVLYANAAGGTDEHEGKDPMQIPETEHHEKSHHTWSYNIGRDATGPERWSELFPEFCGGTSKHQSPIDVVLEQVKHNENLEDIDLIGAEAAAGKSMELLNNGHAAQVNVEGDVRLVGGNLGDVYKMAQFHFHWGSDDTQGSEHLVNGKGFPLEAHVIFYDAQKYNDLTTAASAPNGLAVFSVLFEVGEEDNEILAPVVSKLHKLIHPNKEHTEPIEWVDIGKLFPERTHHYYRYPGSLTTPMCMESVIWTIFADHRTISKAQLETFRELHEGEKEDGGMELLVNNRRPVQPLNDRQVQASFRDVEAKYRFVDDAEVVNAEFDSDGSAASKSIATGVATVLMCLAALLIA